LPKQAQPLRPLRTDQPALRLTHTQKHDIHPAKETP
jgi:hypothetical protein